MCDAKNTTEDGKCMDARKDECKWYVDGKCGKITPMPETGDKCVECSGPNGFHYAHCSEPDTEEKK